MDIELWKKRKKLLKMTYDQLSELSGIPRSTLFDIFRGVTTAPRIDTVQAIDKALGMFLSDEEIEGEGLTTFRKAYISPEEHLLLCFFRDLGKEKGELAQQAILALLERLLHEETNNNKSNNENSDETTP